MKKSLLFLTIFLQLTSFISLSFADKKVIIQEATVNKITMKQGDKENIIKSAKIIKNEHQSDIIIHQTVNGDEIEMKQSADKANSTQFINYIEIDEREESALKNK